MVLKINFSLQNCFEISIGTNITDYRKILSFTKLFGTLKYRYSLIQVCASMSASKPALHLQPPDGRYHFPSPLHR